MSPTFLQSIVLKEAWSVQVSYAWVATLWAGLPSSSSAAMQHARCQLLQATVPAPIAVRVYMSNAYNASPTSWSLSPSISYIKLTTLSTTHRVYPGMGKGALDSSICSRCCQCRCCCGLRGRREEHHHLPTGRCQSVGAGRGGLVHQGFRGKLYHQSTEHMPVWS